ncbi:MAG: hypothetical protein ABI162_00595 [Luteolibacter sp.]
MLRRTDEKAAAPVARVENRPGTSGTHETTPRMTAIRSTTSMTTGFFRFHGQGAPKSPLSLRLRSTIYC